MLFRRENFSFNLCCRNYFHNRLQDLQMLTNISSVINKKKLKVLQKFSGIDIAWTFDLHVQ